MYHFETARNGAVFMLGEMTLVNTFGEMIGK
jgi:hypothetical protein